jgi:predicted nucleic acid-binding protein
LILVDTSVWVDHLRRPEPALDYLILTGQVVGHPYVTGEVALGDVRAWDETVSALQELVQARVASEAEFLALISNERLAATGMGFVEIHILASCRITPDTRLWSRDKRLARYADRLGIGWQEA